MVGPTVENVTATNARVQLILGATQYAIGEVARTDEKALHLADFFLYSATRRCSSLGAVVKI